VNTREVRTLKKALIQSLIGGVLLNTQYINRSTEED